MAKGSMLAGWAKYYLLCAVVLLVVLIGLSSDIYSVDDPVVMRRILEGFGVAVIVVMAILSWALWLPLTKRLSAIGEAVRSYAKGDFSPRLPADDGTELGQLSEDLNWMAQQLHCRHVVETSRQQEQEAVLASMTEGVMAIDADGCFINMNRAARRILHTEHDDIEGRAISDMIRQEELLRFIRHALSTDDPMKEHLVLNGSPPKHVLVDSTVLTGSTGQRLGVLIVLNDVTEVRRLETMRRDFVANVSHELKTPITSIKGFMETLLDGAMDNPDDARKFLQIIAKQADRLDAIIEDLLSLSRIEQESERGEIVLKQGRIVDVLNAVALAIHSKAEARGVQVDVSASDMLTARINAPLLEQAVVNLVDNAIKYSEAGMRVRVTAEERPGGVCIAVADTGPGIPKEHHARIFERFYRVDKSRSRQLGGTGLGLSIVKHITQAHGGTVSVQSAPGKGSTFTIHLPVR